MRALKLPGHLKLGLSKSLVVEAVENTGGPGKSSGWKWWLWTSVGLYTPLSCSELTIRLLQDAHDLYKNVLGFSQPKEGGREMERFAPNT